MCRHKGWLACLPLVLVLTVAASLDARAQESAFLKQISTFLDEQTSRIGGKVEIAVGQLDSHLALAPCRTIEPFLPASSRLWGKTLIGLRCVEGANWSVSLPVTVRVFGQALVARQALQAGRPLSAGDFEERDVELSLEASPAVIGFDQLEGRVLSRSIAVGTVLRQDWLRPMPVIQAGDAVHLVVNGTGFSIAAEGIAVASAVDGQSVRARAEGGKMVTGTARPGRIVEILQ